jgi:hypothetical protein
MSKKQQIVKLSSLKSQRSAVAGHDAFSHHLNLSTAESFQAIVAE